MSGMVDDERRPPICLPPELLLMIAKHLDDTDCMAISLSGAFVGFTSLYYRYRNLNSITVNYKCFFLSKPRTWNKFLCQQSPSPLSVTSFNSNNCYWLPAKLLCDALVKMKNLEELSIKETKVSLPHLARVLEHCPKITKLDFTFYEKKWEEIQDAVMNEAYSIDSIIQGFKKLTCLKMSTRWLDARDFVNDPWVIIIRLLSWCRDCVELTVEVTYAGDDFDARIREDGSRGFFDAPLTPAQEKIQQESKDLFPKLKWMMSLKKLALLKFGRFTTISEDYFIVHSQLLEDLLDWLLDKERERSSLECLWIQDFMSPTFHDSNLLNDVALKSYYVKSEEHDYPNEAYSRFCNIEHLAGVEVISPLAKLSNLKYFRSKSCNLGGSDDEEEAQKREVLDDFHQNHQDLEFLFLELFDSDYVPKSAYKIPKLKVLYFEQEIINKKLIDSFVELYPNLEFLQLNNYRSKSEILEERECLSAIRFRNLTSLHLYGSFELDDGAFLLPIIEQCPKLASLHMSGSLRPTSFLWNFDLFLQLAVNLRDLRLHWDPEGDGITLFLLLKYLIGSSLQLERLVLIAKSPKNETDWDHPIKLPDLIVKFALKMKRLVCCCIVFDRMDSNLIKEIQQRIAKEIVPIRPSLWFHLGREKPLASDPSVPSIHYHEMVDPIIYVPPPSF